MSVTRTFLVEQLSAANPDLDSLTWARQWARQMAGDVPNEAGDWPLDSKMDAEWNGWLESTKSTVYAYQSTTVLATYYRPHEAAARALKANPYWLQRKTVRGYTEEYRSLEEVVQGIKDSGAWIDALISRTEWLAGRSWSGQKEFEVVF